MAMTEVANVASGVVMAALGAFVLTLKPRRPGNVAFAVFSVSWGVGIGLGNWAYFLEASPWAYFLAGNTTSALAFLGLSAMMFSFPAPVTGPRRRWVWMAIAGPLVAAAAIVAMVLAKRDFVPASALFPNVPVVITTVYGVATSAVAFAVAAYLIVIAFLVRPVPAADPLRRQYQLVTVALLLYAGYVSGGGVFGLFPVFPVTAFILSTSGVLFGAMVVLSALWLRESSTGPDPKAARNIALLCLALPLVGLLLSAFGGAYVGRGVLRTLCVVVLAYAMVRHQLLGIDVKVRWTISKSTIAAVFIAVFFIASEGAQILFGQQNELVGLVAAGGLVFALSPLQRAADRFAQKAVPLAVPSAPDVAKVAAVADLEAFRHVARRLASDGTVSVADHHALAVLAEQLGLGAVAVADALADAEAAAHKPRRRH